MNLATIKMKEIQDAVGPLNLACGLEIKDRFRKKDEIVDEFIEVMSSRLDEAPQVSIDLYNKLKGNGAAPDPAPEAVEPVVVEVEEEVKAAMVHATIVGIKEIPDGISLEDLETLIYDTTGSMSADDWDKLPEETQRYDNDLVERRKAAKAETSEEHIPAEEPEKEASDGDSEKAEAADTTDETKPEPATQKPKQDPKAPRPDFRYNPNTSAGMIMAILVKLAAECDNKGVKEADILAAGKAEKIASVNLKGRVSTVLRYAATPPGGSQCSKEGGLWISNVE